MLHATLRVHCSRALSSPAATGVDHPRPNGNAQDDERQEDSQQAYDGKGVLQKAPMLSAIRRKQLHACRWLHASACAP